MSNIRRNLQYLKSLKAQREQKRTQMQEIEAEIAHLRKNPTDKLTNDLLVYSNNKKREILKEEISSLDKEIYKLNSDITQNSDEVESLAPSEIEEFSQELTEIFPEPQEVELEPEEVEEATPSQLTQQAPIKASAFSQLINGYKSTSKLIVSSLISLVLVWTLFQWDAANLLTYFSKLTRFNIFSFTILGFLSFTIVSYVVYRDLTKKEFGSRADYFILITTICTLGVLGLFIKNKTTFKLLIFAFLATYSLVYYILRLCLYKKDLTEVTQKNRFVKYYYNLFSRVSPLVVGLIVIVCFALLYITMTTSLFKRWLVRTDAYKVLMIINTVIIALAYLYAIAFSIVRINEPKVYIIDLIALLTEIVTVQFFIINNFISAKASTVSIIAVSASFIFALVINIYRILKIKK